ncbi:hypothetical protein QO034_20910 [Sedimentitalea sp. JM2-8]|uniref:Uncharacterized protein n=1 Tax=Sedimentitalea xiamensis TaxID=3050037 RepID=A0ABT7FK54_9RHOB|nr:hypothetical protein [Sedimentitalea xiamensis]MDK3075541.1 hypothetical protein [Sedimentitalea xiamensis]
MRVEIGRADPSRDGDMRNGVAIAPWLIFVCGVLGLIVGDGVEVFQAPTEGFVRGLDMPTVLRIPVPAIDSLGADNAPLNFD